MRSAEYEVNTEHLTRYFTQLCDIYSLDPVKPEVRTIRYLIWKVFALISLLNTDTRVYHVCRARQQAEYYRVRTSTAVPLQSDQSGTSSVSLDRPWSMVSAGSVVRTRAILRPVRDLCWHRWRALIALAHARHGVRRLTLLTPV